MNEKIITPLHVILLTMTVIGLKNHVTIIPPVLYFAGRDGWITIILASMLMLPWLFLLLYIHNKTNYGELLHLMKKKCGIVLYYTFVFSFGLYLLYVAAFSMRETLQWMHATFLMDTPILVLLIIFILLCGLLASSGIETIMIANVFVLFFVIVFGFFVAIVNIQVKDYTLLLPLLEHDFSKITKAMIYPASGIIELSLLIFIQHRIKGKMTFIHYLIIVIILLWLTLGPLIGAIIEFGPTEAMKQRFPAYEEWGLVTIGRFIEHLDFLSIYQWLGGAFIRIGFLLFICLEVFQVRNKPKWTWGMIVPIFLVLTLILIKIEDQRFFEWKRLFILPSTFVVLSIVSLFLFLFTWFTSKKSRRAAS